MRLHRSFAGGKEARIQQNKTARIHLPFAPGSVQWQPAVWRRAGL